jgi:hypothetical protein
MRQVSSLYPEGSGRPMKSVTMFLKYIEAINHDNRPRKRVIEATIMGIAG